MAMSKPSKHRKTGIYWFRRRVPDDCQSVIGKREWSKTLETTDLRVAQRAILKYIVETDEQIQAIRSGTFRQYANEQLEHIAMSWGIDFRHQLESYQMLPPTTQDFTDEVYGPISSEAELDESIQKYLDRMDWAELGPKIESGSPDYEVLRKHCFDEHRAGYVWGRPKPLERLKSQPEPIKPEDGPTLLQTFELYLKEAQPASKTIREFRKALDDFCALNGGDLPLRSITKKMVVGFKNLLLQKPFGLSRKQAAMNLRDLVESVAGQDLKTISLGTVKKNLSPINVVMNYAIKNDHIEVNPAANIAPPKSKKSSTDDRLPYSIEDLDKIFSSPVWTGSQSRGRRGDPGEVIIQDAKFWVPLLAMWTGARFEELCQLTIADVKREDGIDYLDLAVIEDGQTLKTPGSVRQIPIHSELIRLGFLDYVKRQRSKMLFPELKQNPDGSYSSSMVKWWGRYARGKLGITDTRKVFHSFRHAFTDAGRRCKVDKFVVMALQGHKDGSVSGGYGSGYPLETLNDAMQQIQYHGLDLKL